MKSTLNHSRRGFLKTPDPASKLKQVLAETDNKDVLLNMLLNPRLTMPRLELS